MTDAIRQNNLAGAERESRLAAIARKDVVKAAEFCLRSASTGEPLTLYDGHYELMDAVAKHKQLVVIAAPRLGKSTLLTYMLLLFRLGHDPKRYRAKIWSANKTNATRHSMKVRTQIETNKRLLLMFPDLAPGPKWTEEEWTVDRGGGSDGEAAPSVWACGEDSQNQGFRSQDDFYDDMVDPVISASRYRCEKQADFVMENVSRIEASGQRLFIQNCFRRWDTGHILAEKFGWHLHLMKSIDDETGPGIKYGKTLYPVIWPQEAINAYPPSQIDQDHRCIPRREGDSIFQEAYLQKAMALGEGLLMPKEFGATNLPDGQFTVTAIDPAGGKKKKKSDLTAGTTLLAAPPQHFGLPAMGVDAKGVQIRASRILNVESGKMPAPEMRAWIIDLHRRYGSAVFVEDAAVQDWMRQLLATDAADVPVGAFSTNAGTKRHADLGFESLAARFSMGLIIIPSWRDASGVLRVEPEIHELLEELRRYDPESHTGDRAMSLWMADVKARTMRGFTHQIDVAGVPIADDELRAVGFTDAEIQFTRPTNPEFEAMAAEAEAEHQESQAPATVIPIDAAAKEAAKKAAETERRMMGDLIRRQVGESAFALADTEDPEIADIIASRF